MYFSICSGSVSAAQTVPGEASISIVAVATWSPMISSSLGLGWAYPSSPPGKLAAPRTGCRARKRGTVCWVVASWTTGGIAAVAVLTPVGPLSATGVNGEAIVA